MTQTFAANSSLSTEQGQTDQLTNLGYRLVLQGDGNLVLYEGDTALWASSTSDATRFAVQDDGNLVLYNSAGTAVWSSETSGNAGATLVLQDDGNLVLIDSGGSPLWATNTLSTGTYQAPEAAPAPKPEAVPPPAAPATPAPRTYTVQAGDLLSAIASQFGLDSWQPIFDANRAVIGDDPDLIQPGMVLTIPA